MTQEYCKLVRDNIPDIIRKKGEKPVTRVLEDNEYDLALSDKLLEEVREFVDDFSLGELADVLEVVQASSARLGYIPAELEAERAWRAKEHSGIFFEGVTEKGFDPTLRDAMKKTAKEFTEEPSLWRLADMLELVMASAVRLGYTPQELEAERERKATERGGFYGRIFLEKVIEVESDQ